MANQVTNYKCPACTGPLRFDSATGKLQCDFCGSSYEVAEVEKLYAEKDAQAAGAFRQAEEQAAADGEWASASGSDWGADAEKLRVYSCPSCGAELICDETTSATSCPYCGNNTIVPGQFSGALKPDYVLPFKLDKAAAVAALKKHYGGKKLLPKAFSNENHIEEVKGVYVPFWLYDGSAEVDVRCHGTKVSGYSTARENVTVTNHYDVRRAGTVRFERVRWTPRARCLTTTWTPSSPSTTRSSSPFPRRICPASSPTSTTFPCRTAPNARTAAAKRAPWS